MITESLSGLKILIVEDIVPTQQMLRLVLSKFYAHAEFVTARTVEAAMACLDESLRDTPFDVAILDFKLPLKYVGDNPELETSVSRQFTSLSRETVLVHITAYPDDVDIQRYLSHRSEMMEAGHLFVAKDEETTGNWFQVLVDRLTTTLHNRRVRMRFEKLFNFGAGAIQQRIAPRYGLSRCDRERGLELAVLCSDAEAHWGSLSPSLRADLQQALGGFQDSAGRPRLGIINLDQLQGPAGNPGATSSQSDA